MAVAKYPEPLCGGLERQAHELAKALNKSGHTVQVVSTRFDRSQTNCDELDGVQISRASWSAFAPWRFICQGFSLARLLPKLIKSADVVHVHNVSWFGAYVTVFAKTFGRPVMTKLPNHKCVAEMRRSRAGLLRIWLLKKSDVIVALTSETVNALERIGYPLRRVLRVSNGIDSSLAPAVPAKSLKADETIIVSYVGRLEPEKGLVDLLHAWTLVKIRSTHKIRLLIFGDGSQYGELKRLATALGHIDTVYFCGHCSDVGRELAASDVFVLPSYGEGNSNAILEAMRAAIPVVATDVGGAPVQLGGESRHCLFTPGDRELLAHRLLAFIESSTLRTDVGRALRLRTLTVFSIDRVARVYIDAYTLMVSGKHDMVATLTSDLFVPRDLPSASNSPLCAP
jgi:glycosyltransferase involved in cell wall biosynthesis